MTESPQPAGFEALQVLPSSVPATAAAAEVAIRILTGTGGIADAVELAAELLVAYPDVDLVAASLVLVHPEDTRKWVSLGERAWLREWRREGARCSVAPSREGTADQAISLPWLSPAARVGGVAVIDIELLPAEASQDRRELGACGVRAVLAHSIVRDNVLYGSIAVAREKPGPWPDACVADVRLLSAALISRMAEERARLVLADAIKRGDLARASQQEFFSAIGHELRTPIAAIVGTAEMLGGDARDLLEAGPSGTGAEPPASVTRFAAGAAKDADVVLSAGEQLLAIVDDLLETGQELGGGTESQWVDVADAVSDVVHWLRTPALSAGISVTADVPPGLLVLTTPSGLRQILTNLVGNAITHNSPGGSVRVTTSTTRDEFGEPRALVSVQDAGPGLTPEQQRDVFKPFVRFAGPEVRGTGLGLSLSRSLAERDGGMMGLDSTPGEGSVFWVDLPAAPSGTVARS